MLTAETKSTIEALSDEELEYELARGRASRFQREKYDYLKVVHNRRQQAKDDGVQAATLQVAEDGVKATKSNTRWATAGWVVGGLIAAAAIVAGMLTGK